MVRKCVRGIAEMAVMEVGVRTRSMAAMSSGTAKRRNVRELVRLSSTKTRTKKMPFVELANRRRSEIAPGRVAGENCSSARSSDREGQVSCCSSNGSSEIADDRERVRGKIEEGERFADLKDDESNEVETSTYNFYRERREMTPSSNLREEESDAMESTAKPTVVNSDNRSTVIAEKMPSESELEEFFAAAEKDIQKRFAEKYNYDIAKDTPLEGRYEWIRLKP